MKRWFVIATFAVLGAVFCIGPCAFTACCPAAPEAVSRPKRGATPADACATLAAVSCPEGGDPLCADVLGRALDARLYELRSIECLAGARSRAEVRSCGIARCEVSR